MLANKGKARGIFFVLRSAESSRSDLISWRVPIRSASIGEIVIASSSCQMRPNS